MKTYGGRCAKRWPSVGSTVRRVGWQRRRPSLYPLSPAWPSSSFRTIGPSLKVHDSCCGQQQQRTTVQSGHWLLMSMNNVCQTAPAELRLLLFRLRSFPSYCSQQIRHSHTRGARHENGCGLDRGGEGSQSRWQFICDPRE